MNFRTLPCVAAMFLLAWGCDKKDVPAVPSAPAAAPAAASAASGAGMAPTPTRELGIAFDDPPGWKRLTPSSAMRAASFEVPPAAGDPEAGDLGVFYFGPTQGGSLEQNVKRWRDSFPDVAEDKVKRSQRNPSGLLQHLVEIEDGTYSSGMPGAPKTPKAGYALLGAIVEAPTGNYYFKLTGPKATVAAARPKFLSLLDSVKPKS